MNIKSIQEKLRSIGFKENESKVLFVLLKGTPLSASQIAKEANIIRNSIYDILKDFVERGYCNEIETNTILNYRCIELQVLVDKIEKEFNDNNKSRIITLHETVKEIKDHYSSRKKTEDALNNDINIELVRGFNKHRMEKYIEYLRGSRKRVLGMYKLRGIVSSELDKIAKDFMKRGGELRSIYWINLDFKIAKDGKAIPASSADLINVCESFQKAGERLRLCEMEIPNMTIFDDEVVFNNITDMDIPKHKSADIVVTNKSNARYMTDLFEYYWQNSLTLDQYRNNSKEN